VAAKYELIGDDTVAQYVEITIRDVEQDGKPVVITLDKIASAIQHIINTPREELKIAKSYVDHIQNGSRENDACDIDAECADIILQVAVLGEIIYG